MLLKHYLGQRVSKTDLARRPGVDRRTIHNRVRPGQLNLDVSAFSARAGGSASAKLTDRAGRGSPPVRGMPRLSASTTPVPARSHQRAAPITLA